MNHVKLAMNIFAVAAALTVGTVSSPALANVDNCTVTRVGLDSGALQIFCQETGATANVAALAAGDCSVSPDALKGFLSMAEAALLSGKSLYLQTGCNSATTVNSVTLKK